VAAAPDPGRLVRKSINLATNRLGDRRKACRVIVHVARAARGAAIAAEGQARLDPGPISAWLDEVVLQAERMARLAGVDV
jgi:hypothetical protein